MEYAKHAMLFVICFLTFLTQSDNFLTGNFKLEDLANISKTPWLFGRYILQLE